ncbi:hypothetical protein ABPG74_006384 [Tetrahymena malaccensis]
MSSSRRSGSNTIFVGKLSSRVREEDLRDEFRRYGRIRDIDFRRQRGFAFIEYNSSSDAKQAVEDMNGQRFEDTRIVVQYKENRSDRNRRGPTTVDVCYNCGRKGHWANECKEGNWNNRCYRCGKSGHLKKECSLSRTPSSRRESPRRSRRNRSQSGSKSKSVSDSRSRSRSKDKNRDKKRRQSYSKSSSRSKSSRSSRRSYSSSKSRASSSRSKSRSSNSSKENNKNQRKSMSESRSRRNSNDNRSSSPPKQN